MKGQQNDAKLKKEKTMTIIDMLTGKELARLLRFEGTTAAFRAFCKETGIRPLPGRRDCYDPIFVREKLNEAQGLGVAGQTGRDLLELSKERRNAT